MNDLKTEMGQNSLKDVSKLDLLQIESKIQNSQKHAELLGKLNIIKNKLYLIFLTEKCSKLEIEAEFHKSKCSSLEEKYLEEKRKNVKLEEMFRDQENEIRKLNMYLKESDDYSKEIQKECHYVKQEV